MKNNAYYAINKVVNGEFGSLNLTEDGMVLDGKYTPRHVLDEFSNVRDNRQLGNLLGIGTDIIALAAKAKEDYTDKYQRKSKYEDPYKKIGVV